MNVVCKGLNKWTRNKKNLISKSLFLWIFKYTRAYNHYLQWYQTGAARNGKLLAQDSINRNTSAFFGIIFRKHGNGRVVTIEKSICLTKRHISWKKFIAYEIRSVKKERNPNLKLGIVFIASLLSVFSETFSWKTSGWRSLAVSLILTRPPYLASCLFLKK